MPTDDERREVARRLRDMRLNPWDDAACEIALCVGIVCCNSECHGSDETPECTMALCDRLADLIEPEERTCRDDGVGVFRCTRCGAFVLHNSVTDLCGPIPITYFPNCGARVVKEES